MTILERIVEYKRDFVEEMKVLLPLDIVKEAAHAAPPTRGFAKRLLGTRAPNGDRIAQETLRVIAEVKRASPSKGIIREDFDPAAIACGYEAGGASGVSVLTDEQFFKGSLDILREVRAACPDLPLLRKEFMIDPYQVYEARAAGADCILLIAGMIPWPVQRILRTLAQGLGMDVLMEVHGADELPEALALEPDLLGVNNRDLRSADLSTDVSRTEELLGQIPPTVTLVSESGIRDRADIERLKRAGIDAILVGEHLMREPIPGAAIHAKLGLGKSIVS